MKCSPRHSGRQGESIAESRLTSQVAQPIVTDISVIADFPTKDRPSACSAKVRYPMPQQVQAVIARSKGAPVELVDVIVPDPGPNDVVVRIQACGVCHTDLTTARAASTTSSRSCSAMRPPAWSRRSGGRHDVELGDFVVLNWRAVCGRCRACRRGRPWYCFDTHNASAEMTLADGTELTPALGIGAFAEKTLVARGAMHQGRPGRRPRGGGPARLRRDGRHRRRDEHRQRLAGGLRRGDRLRRRG